MAKLAHFLGHVMWLMVDVIQWQCVYLMEQLDWSNVFVDQDLLVRLFELPVSWLLFFPSNQFHQNLFNFFRQILSTSVILHSNHIRYFEFWSQFTTQSTLNYFWFSWTFLTWFLSLFLSAKIVSQSSHFCGAIPLVIVWRYSFSYLFILVLQNVI